MLGFLASKDVLSYESRTNSAFGAGHSYRDFSGTALWPGTTETRLAARRQAGARLVGDDELQRSLRRGAAAGPRGPWPATPTTAARRKIWTYHQIINGSMDRYIDTIARRVKASPGNYLIDFNHEADDTPDMGGSNTQRAAAGSRTQYAAAYRHLVDRFRGQGVRNVAWGWTLSGWYAGDRAKWPALQQMWPGRGYVDIIMWDPYNNNRGNWRSLNAVARRVYDAVQAGMLDRVDPTAKNLRFGLGEFGSIRDNRRPAWLRSSADRPAPAAQPRLRELLLQWFLGRPQR